MKIELEKIYELLKGIGAVQSEAEFSKKWLGESECYWRSLRFKKATAKFDTKRRRNASEPALGKMRTDNLSAA